MLGDHRVDLTKARLLGRDYRNAKDLRCLGQARTIEGHSRCTMDKLRHLLLDVAFEEDRLLRRESCNTPSCLHHLNLIKINNFNSNADTSKQAITPHAQHCDLDPA